MKILNEKEKKSKTVSIISFCVMLIFVFLNLSIEGCAKMNNKNGENLGHLNFSPDGKSILFISHNDKSKGALINIYYMETGELKVFNPPSGESWSMAKYSYDGRKIVFNIIPFVAGKYEIDKTQIAIMDVDGKNYIKLTNSNGFKVYPSFSHNGKRIIYCKAGAIRTSGRTPAADYDIYEIDLNNGIEKRITDMKLFSMSAPSFFPDDETIIFSTYGYSYNKKTREIAQDEIYTIKKGQKKPVLLFYSKNGLRNPSITINGAIYFETQAYKPDGSGNGDQIFQYSADGRHRQLSNIPWSQRRWATVSHDGQRIAVVFEKDDRKVVIYNVLDSTTTEIILPDKPSIVSDSMS